MLHLIMKLFNPLKHLVKIKLKINSMEKFINGVESLNRMFQKQNQKTHVKRRNGYL